MYKRQEIGVSPSRVNDYISGRSEPTLKIARLLCRVLNIPVSYTHLAEPAGFVSAAIHSSVSGKVAKIDTIVDASGYAKPAIFIAVSYTHLDVYKRQVESGAQVHFSTLGVECVGEYPFGMFALILRRYPAQAVKKLTSCFAAIRCDGE